MRNRTVPKRPERPDPHSHFNPSQPRQKTLDWRFTVDFATRTLDCEAAIRFSKSGLVDLDTRDLLIESVTDVNGQPIDHQIGEPHAVIGSRLRIHMPKGTRSIVVKYKTTPEASGLQWLTPEQTDGKTHHLVYSQNQQIHARSMVPCQDTALARLTYRAEITVPTGYQAVMAVDQPGQQFKMTKPIPPYLIGLAVGRLDSHYLTPRNRVWAEPSVLARAAKEFARVGDYMTAAEKLFGPYQWGRFDILVMPPSFPYGGMENPCLTFVTPSLLVGDGSGMSVIGHELFHAWTGNLVTNATAEHFWLNEGWTTFAQFALDEAVRGVESSTLGSALLSEELKSDLARFRDTPEYTLLRTTLTADDDADKLFSRVPYCKGYLFLKALEAVVGVKKFRAFVKKYIRHFAWHSITTEQFLAFLKRELPAAYRGVDIQAWVYQPGLPEGAPAITSDLLTEIQQAASEQRIPSSEEAGSWGGDGLALYLARFSRQAPASKILEFGNQYGLARHPNHDVRWSFLCLALEAGLYEDVSGALDEFLAAVGRMKYLRPLYTLVARHVSVDKARELFATHRGGYHLTTQKTVDSDIERVEKELAAA